jgi:hypothetical protein
VRIEEKSYIEEMIEDLRKITEFNVRKQHTEDLDAVNKWILELIKNTNDEYLKQYLVQAKKLINNKEMILPFFYYQVQFVINGGRF